MFVELKGTRQCDNYLDIFYVLTYVFVIFMYFQEDITHVQIC